MQKNWLLFFVLILVVGFFAVGAFSTAHAASEPTVAVSVVPQQWAVRQVGGDQVRTLVLVPAGADPHTFEPKPSQVAQLAGADVFFTIGLEFEKAWLGRLAGAKPDLRVVSMLDGNPSDLAVHAGEAHDHAEHAGEAHDHAEHAGEAHDHAEHAGHHHHHHDGLDPHVWTAPQGMIRMLDGTLRELVRLDPAHADAYRARHARALERVQTLDREIHDLLRIIPEERRVFLVFHPAWGHFAESYGLRQLSIEMEGKEPGPGELAGVIREAARRNVHAVFIQPQMSRRTAGQVARALDGRVIPADPLAEDWENNLRAVARAFRMAMSGGGQRTGEE
ncbi:MAG: zinc ABC transporter substrate-binding protein [Desulfovibrio sp.]|nr:zinc ABC transporter substrate-binding protein [Desulfovibrio sp.]